MTEEDCLRVSFEVDELIRWYRSLSKKTSYGL